MIKWLRETYLDIPTHRGWIGLVMAIVVVVSYMDGAV